MSFTAKVIKWLAIFGLILGLILIAFPELQDILWDLI